MNRKVERKLNLEQDDYKKQIQYLDKMARMQKIINLNTMNIEWNLNT